MLASLDGNRLLAVALLRQGLPLLLQRLSALLRHVASALRRCAHALFGPNAAACARLASGGAAALLAELLKARGALRSLAVRTLATVLASRAAGRPPSGPPAQSLSTGVAITLLGKR